MTAIQHISQSYEDSLLKPFTWADFLQQMQQYHPKKGANLHICLPESNLLLRPLPEYPFLNNKAMHKALHIYDEQVLIDSPDKYFISHGFHPTSVEERKKENRWSGMMYALKREPFQCFLDACEQTPFHLDSIVLRPSLYLELLGISSQENQLILLEIQADWMRIHFLESGLLTHYRDFNWPDQKDCQTPNSLQVHLQAYLHYLIQKNPQAIPICVFCVSESNVQSFDRMAIIHRDWQVHFPNIHFLEPLEEDKTAQITQLLCMKPRGNIL
ncbi:hypothetical protein SDC9_71654 [bioreactor metagenome]|uniref:Uncharacterized protein n=1 Tax=bioreactor metagenome TaxID=1076179 RepID=A0A644YGC7_9ZZZZ